MKKFDISKFSPCSDGLEYYNNQVDFETAWNNCERGDWMLWMSKKLDVDEKKLFLAKGHCANLVRHLMRDEKSIKAVDAAITYGNGEITEEELNMAASASYGCGYSAAASASYAASTSFAETTAYYAADAAADAAAVAAYVDEYTTYICIYNAAANARTKIYKETADICRKYLTEEVMNKIKTI